MTHWNKVPILLVISFICVDVIETIGEIIDEEMFDQHLCNCSLTTTTTGSLLSYKFGHNNSKTFDPVEVYLSNFIHFNNAMFPLL